MPGCWSPIELTGVISLEGAAWSSAATWRGVVEPSAAIATERASFAVVLVRAPSRQQAAPGAQLELHVQNGLAHADGLLGQQRCDRPAPTTTAVPAWETRLRPSVVTSARRTERLRCTFKEASSWVV